MSAQITYWQEPSGFWIGHWNDYPDYDTQGHTLDELREMLIDLREIIASGDLGEIPHRSVEMLQYA